MGSHMKCTKMHHNFGLFWSVLIHFGAFWCTSCVTPRSLHDLLWLLSPFKCPFNPEKDHISHSGKIRNTFALSWYGDHFGAFWCILVHFGAFWCISCVTPWPLHDLCRLLSPFKCPFNPEEDHISHSRQIRNTFALSWYGDHFGPFWCTSWATLQPLSIQFLWSHKR